MSDEADRAGSSPFPGLQPFSDSDVDGALFSGRDAEIELVVANLRAARLTTFYGPSGAGKSSLLHAGVVRRIRARSSRARPGVPAPTVLVHDEWAGDPGAALGRRIAGAAGSETEEMPLDEAIELWSARRRGLLLVILDQFEEYLRLHPDPGIDSFDRLFPEVAGRRDLSVHFLVSLRDDALADLDRFDGRIPGLFDNYLRLPQMTLVAARSAIEQPIARVDEWRDEAGLPRVEVEAGLVDDVLAQLTDPRGWSHETGVGPADGATVEPAFLQLVMKRLWETDSHRRTPLLRRATLTELGGAAAIVRDHLDSAMAALTRDQQATAAAAFGYLVTPSGAKIRYTAEDLAGYAHHPAPAVLAVLEALAAPELRIIRRVPAPSGEAERQGYELFHDVLAGAVRNWGERRRTALLERRTARLTAALATIVAIAAPLIAYAVKLDPLQKLELRAVDARFALRGDRRPDPKIALVALDRRLPRADAARLLDKVAAGGPAAIVEDVEFIDGASPGTAALERAVSRAHTKLLLATGRIDAQGRTTLFGETVPTATFFGAKAAYAGFPTDPDRAVRLVERQGLLRFGTPVGEAQAGASPPTGLNTLATAATELAGGRVDAAAFPSGGAWIDFAGGGGTYRPIPYLGLLGGAVAPNVLRNRIVVIGRTDAGAVDRFRTSAHGGGVLSGPEIQAGAIATVRAGLPLRSVGWPITAALIVVLSLVVSGLALSISLARMLLAAAVAVLLVLVGAQLAFDAGWVATVVYPLLAVVVGAVGNLIGLRGARIVRRIRTVLTPPSRPAAPASPSTRSPTPSPPPRRSASDPPSG